MTRILGFTNYAPLPVSSTLEYHREVTSGLIGGYKAVNILTVDSRSNKAGVREKETAPPLD
jgi:hypothetical protein